MSTQTTAQSDLTTSPARNSLFSALVGLTTLAIFGQFLWAGMMIREGKDYDATWVGVHDWGARIAFVLAVAAAIVAVAKLRSRLDLVVGAALLALLIFAESYVGGLVGDKPAAVAVHIPLGAAIFALAVWLPFRTTRHRTQVGN